MCGLRAVPDHLLPESVSMGWTPRTQAIADILMRPPFGATVGAPANGTQAGHVSNSFHYCGRAIDASPPGASSGHPATGDALRKGWSVANWAAHNAAKLNVAEVIFYDRIWTVARSTEGWRPYVHAEAVGDPDTLQHRDHVHISVY
jgi:hypothetical protein